MCVLIDVEGKIRKKIFLDFTVEMVTTHLS